MTYYKDMDLCEYDDGPHSASSWHCPLLAVGWLDGRHPFSVGEVSIDVLAKLKSLAYEFGAAFPSLQFRGLHTCSICYDTMEGVPFSYHYFRGFNDRPISSNTVERGVPLKGSGLNLFIPGTNAVFIAPGRIDHYIEDHSYNPPPEFLDAVESCASPLSPAYRENLHKVNHGNEAPLYENRY